MPNIGLPELLVIVAVALLFFGGKRLGDIGKGIGEGIRNFRSAVKEDKPAEHEKGSKSSD
jgi:sec-independent protein translocase protein TatA